MVFIQVIRKDVYIVDEVNQKESLSNGLDELSLRLETPFDAMTQ